MYKLPIEQKFIGTLYDNCCGYPICDRIKYLYIVENKCNKEIFVDHTKAISFCVREEPLIYECIVHIV